MEAERTEGLAGRTGSALLPCPFCGGEPRIHEWYFGAVVLCSICKARGPEAAEQGRRGSTAALAWRLWEGRSVLSPNARITDAAQRLGKQNRRDGAAFACIRLLGPNHPDRDVQQAIIRLNDALCMWERSTGRESVVIIREQGGFSHRSMSGKPGIPDDVPDAQLLGSVLS